MLGYVLRDYPPPHTHTQLGMDTQMATLRQHWWSITKGERFQMHAFTYLSKQLRQKVRYALLRNLHYTSLYQRLILNNKLRDWQDHTICGEIHAPPSHGKRLGGHNPPKYRIRLIV